MWTCDLSATDDEKEKKKGDEKVNMCQIPQSIVVATARHCGWVVTKLDTPKSDYQERTGTEWLVLGLGWG